MVFSSVTFLVYFLPALLLVYYFTPTKFRNALLLIASVLFYSWGAPKFIFVILATTFIDYFLVQKMDRAGSDYSRKLLLVLSVSINLSLLFYFKYCNFFIENANEVLESNGHRPIRLLNIILPIGISFYTFESITYVVDVYRRVHKPLTNVWDYQLYILLFPKLIAGPIIRYHEIADQLRNREGSDSVENKLQGFLRFSIGLAKKVFIANNLAVYADAVFDAPSGDVGTGAAWIGMLCYTFQIYFDFSGYSDMAIGLGQMFGFRFPENFNNPYVSQSITEFWRRWHITLGKWMKNYLYIPLGGNRSSSELRVYFNLWLVFLASGLWHGASWVFIAWGIYHGFFLVFERIFLLKVYSRLGKTISTALTFLFVAIGWVIFRSDNLIQAGHLIKTLFDFRIGAQLFYLQADFYFYFLLALIFSFFTFYKKGERIQEQVYFKTRMPSGYFRYSMLSLFLFVISLAYLASSDFNPFIYFRF